MEWEALCYTRKALEVYKQLAPADEQYKVHNTWNFTIEISVYLIYIDLAPLHRYYIVSEVFCDIHLCETFQCFIPFYEEEPPSPRSVPRGAYR